MKEFSLDLDTARRKAQNQSKNLEAIAAATALATSTASLYLYSTHPLFSHMYKILATQALGTIAAFYLTLKITKNAYQTR